MPRPDWSRPLPRPLVIPTVMTLKTLDDVRKLMGHLPAATRAKSTWQYVATCLDKAARGADPAAHRRRLARRYSVIDPAQVWALLHNGRKPFGGRIGDAPASTPTRPQATRVRPPSPASLSPAISRPPVVSTPSNSSTGGLRTPSGRRRSSSAQMCAVSRWGGRLTATKRSPSRSAGGSRARSSASCWRAP